MGCPGSRESGDDVFVGGVLAWGGPRLRDLPWRRTREEWPVLVSEVMSQQTGVERVVPKWVEFMERFPTVGDCARAELPEILGIWQGLGYPRRARNLHLAARSVAAAGAFPTDLAGWLALPGVGPYTARAVMAFAQSAEVAVVDTNVARVLARRLGRSLGAREVQSEADRLVPAGDAWLWNQSLMELGATVCRARSPSCDDCPVERGCRWRGSADVDDPARTTAGTSRPQARFDGSDRQARGALLRRLVTGTLPLTEVAAVVERPVATAERVLESLVDDGLCVVDGDVVRLP
jgi:A/G-specific adenine glycosylase